jgi:F0F1-type ATP synthase gamma subunit
MFDRGESSLECLIEEKYSRLLSPLSNIQGCCLLYQTFKSAVSSIKHSRLLSPLSNIQGCCLLYQTFKAAVSSIKHSRLLSPLSKFERGDSSLECLIEETAALNV